MYKKRYSLKRNLFLILILTGALWVLVLLTGGSEGESREYTISRSNNIPEITITSPMEGEENLSGTYTIEGEYGDIDQDDALFVEVKIDEWEWEAAELGGETRTTEMNSWSYKWNSAKHLNGEHTIYAKVEDENATSYAVQVNITTNNSYLDATIDLILELNESSDILNVTGAVDTKGAYLPERLEIDLDSFSGPVLTVYTNATGEFQTDLSVTRFKVGNHFLEGRVTVPSGATITGNESFIILNSAVRIGEITRGGGTGDYIYSGDVLVAESDITILLYKENMNLPGLTSDIYIFLTKDTIVGFLLQKDGNLKIWTLGGFVIFYLESSGDGGNGQDTLSRGEANGMPDILFDDPLVDETFLDDNYEVVVDFDEVAEFLFFSLDVDENSADVTSYEGLVNVINEDSQEEVEKYRTLSATPTGGLAAGDASYNIVEVDGNVELQFTVDNQDIGNVAGAYHIPIFGPGAFSITIIPEGHEYDVDLNGLGDSEYTLSVSRVKGLEEKSYQVRTTASNDTEDSYSMNRDGNLTIDSKETELPDGTKRTYDIEIIRTNGTGSSSFTGEDYEMIDKTQTFAVTDWDKLDDEKEKPVTYGVDGKEYDFSTGKTGGEVSEIVAGKDEVKSYGLVIGLLLMLLFIGGVVAVGVFKRYLLEKAMEKVIDVVMVEKVFGKKKEEAEVAVVGAGVAPEPETKPTQPTTFPVLRSCPECDSKVKLANPGRFNCHKCDADLVLEEDGTLCTFEGSSLYCIEEEGVVEAKSSDTSSPDYFLSEGKRLSLLAEADFGKKRYDPAITSWQDSLQRYKEARELIEREGKNELLGKVDETITTISRNIAEARKQQASRQMVKLVSEGNQFVNRANSSFNSQRFDEALELYATAKDRLRKAHSVARERNLTGSGNLEKEIKTVEQAEDAVRLSIAQNKLEENEKLIKTDPVRAERVLQETEEYLGSLQVSDKKNLQHLKRETKIKIALQFVSEGCFP